MGWVVACRLERRFVQLQRKESAMRFRPKEEATAWLAPAGSQAFYIAALKLKQNVCPGNAEACMGSLYVAVLLSLSIVG